MKATASIRLTKEEWKLVYDHCDGTMGSCDNDPLHAVLDRVRSMADRALTKIEREERIDYETSEESR